MDSRRPVSVFINCPFDPPYQSLFDALVFVVSYCGFQARSALEVIDSGETRLAKIIALIEGARFSIHDISRVELDPDTNSPAIQHAGTDIKVYGGRVEAVVDSVRAFLSAYAPGPIVGARAICEALRQFETTLPAMVSAARQHIDALNYVDRLRHISAFIGRTTE